MIRLPRRAAASLLLLGALTLAGCTGGTLDPPMPSPSDSPVPSPSPSVSPSPSPSASPSASPSPSTPAAVTVAVVHHPDLIGAFDPPVVQVPVGGTVAWDFQDKGASGNAAVPHNVSGPGFKSATMETGTFTHTFTQAGTVHYVCTLHPGMEGDVTVVAP